MLVTLVVVSAAALVLQGYQFGVATWVFGLRLRPSEWLGLTCVNNLLSYALPVRGGTVARAAYLQRTHGFSLAAYAALTVSSHVLIIAVVSVIGMLAALWPGFGGGGAPSWLVAAFVVGPLAVAAGAWLLGAVGTRLGGEGAGWRVHARAFRASLVTWRDHPGRTGAYVAVTAAVAVLHALRLWVAMHAAGASVSVPGACLLHAAGAASIVFAITPANLGTREAVLAAVGVALGLDVGAVVLAGLLERAVAAAEAAVGSAALGLRFVR